MKSFALVLAGALAAPLAAFAGGPVIVVDEPQIVVPMVSVAPGLDWSGAYGGVALGYGTMTGGGSGHHGNGAIAGAFAGYRYDFGRAVVGGELSYDKDFIDLGAGDNELNSTTRLKFMAGVDAGRALLYATAGVSRANATISGDTAADQGYFGGLGMDFAVNDSWTVGGEVLMDRYKNFNNTGVNLRDAVAQVKIGYSF